MTDQTREIINIFYSLCSIPHPSKGESAVSQWIKQRLESAGYTVDIDACNNMRCRIPASRGRENVPGMILQSHTDMVCVAAPGSEWNPHYDPVSPVIDGDMLSSDRTSTLGADNGIGVAIMIWIALHMTESHGPLMLLFTTGEEQGLLGAKELSPAWLDGYRYYMNLDAFRGDAAIYASAGGMRRTWQYPIEWIDDLSSTGFRITVSGTIGGHSGYDINSGRANALAIMARMLQYTYCKIASFTAGSDYNAIPTFAQAVVATTQPQRFQCIVEALAQTLQKHYSKTDPGLTITLEPCAMPKKLWAQNTRNQVLSFITDLPHTVIKMREDSPDTVADSANLAFVISDQDKLTFRYFARCATKDSMTELDALTEEAASHYGYSLVESSTYAPWEGRADDPFVQHVARSYSHVTGKDMELVPIHVGLESSVILEKAPWLSGISIGCEIHDAHSVTERVSIPSIDILQSLIIDSISTLTEELI